MRSLIAIIGTCLTAVAATGQPVEPVNGTAPWWSNPSAANAPAAKQAAPYGSAVADGTQSKVTELPPPGATGGVAEFAPEPPSRTHRDAAPANLPRDLHDDRPFAGQSAADEGPERAARTGTAPPAPIRLAAATEPVAELARKDKPDASAATNTLRTPPPNLAPAAPGAPRPITPPAIPSPPSTIAAPSAASAAAPAHSITVGGGAPAERGGEKGVFGKTSPFNAMLTVGGSLSIVLGLFLVVAWAMRKTAPRGSLLLPKEVFEILGRAPLGARQQVQLLRCGSKLLLVSITPQGTETLTEVTDPLEVDRIAGICQQGNPKSSTSAFRQVFQQIAAAPESSSAADDLQVSGPRRKRYRWEEKHA